MLNYLARNMEYEKSILKLFGKKNGIVCAGMPINIKCVINPAILILIFYDINVNMD